MCSRFLQMLSDQIMLLKSCTVCSMEHHRKMKRQFSGSVIWRRRESWSCAYVGCNSLVQNCRGGSNDKEVKALDFLNKELGILSDFICAFLLSFVKIWWCS